MALYLFHGDKGGTGKSTLCRAFLDWCVRGGIPVHAIDADTRNADVHRFFGKLVPTDCINLRTEDGWADMVDIMAEEAKAKDVAVNLPGGIGDEDDRRAHVFLDAAHQIGVPIVMFWVINRGVDSVNQLRHQLDHNIATGISRMFCVRNLHFAREGERFDIWDESRTRQMFESKGGKSVDFPALSERVVPILDKDSLAYSQAVDGNLLGMWDAMALKRWLVQVDEFFTGLDLPLVGAHPAPAAAESA